MAMSRLEFMTFTLLANGTTVNVVFAGAYLANTTPLIAIRNKPRIVDYSVTNVTNTGFTLTVAASYAYDETWGYDARGIDV